MTEPEDKATPASTEPKAFYQRWADSFENRYRNRLHEPREKIAAAIEKASKGDIKASAVEGVAPAFGALGIGVAGLVLIDLSTKIGNGALKIASKIVTGFGVFEAIPKVGGAFTALGAAIEAIGPFTGALFTMAASAITFKALQPLVIPDVPAGQLPQNTPGITENGLPPVIITPNTKALTRQAVEDIRTAREKMAEALKAEAKPTDTPASKKSIEKLIEDLGREHFKPAELFGKDPKTGEAKHPTQAQVDAVQSRVDSAWSKMLLEAQIEARAGRLGAAARAGGSRAARWMLSKIPLVNRIRFSSSAPKEGMPLTDKDLRARLRSENKDEFRQAQREIAEEITAEASQYSAAENLKAQAQATAEADLQKGFDQALEIARKGDGLWDNAPSAAEQKAAVDSLTPEDIAAVKEIYRQFRAEGGTESGFLAQELVKKGQERIRANAKAAEAPPAAAPEAAPAPKAEPAAEVAPVEPPRPVNADYAPDATIRTTIENVGRAIRDGSLIRAAASGRMLPESVNPWKSEIAKIFSKALQTIQTGNDAVAQKALANLSEAELGKLAQEIVQGKLNNAKKLLKAIKETYQKAQTLYAEHTAKIEDLTREQAEKGKEAGEELNRKAELEKEAQEARDRGDNVKADDLADQAKQAENEARKLQQEAAQIGEQIQELTTGKRAMPVVPVTDIAPVPEQVVLDGKSYTRGTDGAWTADGAAAEAIDLKLTQQLNDAAAEGKGGLSRADLTIDVQKTIEYLIEGKGSWDGSQPSQATKDAMKHLTPEGIEAATEAYRQHRLEGKNEPDFLSDQLETRARSAKASAEAIPAPAEAAPAATSETAGAVEVKAEAGKARFKAPKAGNVMHGVLVGGLLLDGSTKIYKWNSGIDKIEDMGGDGAVVADYVGEDKLHYRLKRRGDLEAGSNWRIATINCDVFVVSPDGKESRQKEKDSDGVETKLNATKQLHIVDRNGYMGSLTTGGMEVLAGADMAWKLGRPATKLPVGFLREGIAKLGGKGGILFGLSHIGERSIVGFQDYRNGHARAGAAKVTGATADCVTWVVAGPMGLVVGTAPGVLIEKIEAKWMSGKEITADDMLEVTEATLPGTLVIQPIHAVDDDLSKVIARLPEDKRKLWLTDDKGNAVPITRDNIHHMFPHLEQMMMQANYRTMAPVTNEDLEASRKAMIDDPVRAWMKIYNHQITNQGQDKGLSGYTALRDPEDYAKARRMLVEYSNKELSSLKSSAGLGFLVNIPNFGHNLTHYDSSLANMDVEWALTLTAKQMKGYLHEVAPSKENPFRGTGATANTPQDQMLSPQFVASSGTSGTSVPAGPAVSTMPKAEGVPDAIKPNNTKVQTLAYAAAAKDILNNDMQDYRKVELYRDLMHWESQRAADTKKFAEVARKWGERPQHEQDEATVARESLVAAYKRHSLLKDDKEANALIPKAPDIRLTVFEGQEAHRDGFDFPKELEAFGQKMEEHYGVGFFQNKIGESFQKPFAKMENEEKLEFLHAALSHYEQRMEAYEPLGNFDLQHGKQTYYEQERAEGGTNKKERTEVDITVKYDYIDHANDRRGTFDFVTPAPQGKIKLYTGNPNEVKEESWEEEHTFLRDELFVEMGKLGPDYRAFLFKGVDSEVQLLKSRMQGALDIRQLPSSTPDVSPTTFKVTTDNGNYYGSVAEGLRKNLEVDFTANKDWVNLRKGMPLRTLLKDRLSDADRGVSSYQQYLRNQMTRPDGEGTQYQRGIHFMIASQQMLQRGVVLVAADTVNGGNDPSDGTYRPEGPPGSGISWMLFKERTGDGDHYYYASGKWDETNKDHFIISDFIDTQNGRSTPAPKIDGAAPVLDISRASHNDAVSQFSQAFLKYRGIRPIDYANEYAIALRDKLGLASSEASVILADPKKLSNGDMIMVECQDSATRTKYTMGVRCVQTEKGFEMVTETIEAKLSKKHDGKPVKIDISAFADKKDPAKLHAYVVAQTHLEEMRALSAAMKPYIDTNPDDVAKNPAIEKFLDASQQMMKEHKLVLMASDRFDGGKDTTNPAPPPHPAGWLAFKDIRDGKAYYAEGHWEKYANKDDSAPRHDVFVIRELINQENGARIEPTQSLALDMSGNNAEQLVTVPDGAGKTATVKINPASFAQEVDKLKALAPEKRYEAMQLVMKDKPLYKSTATATGLVLPAFAAIQGDKALSVGQQAVLPDCHDNDTNLTFTLKGEWKLRADGEFALQPASATIIMPDKQPLEVSADPNESLTQLRERLLAEFLGKQTKEQRAEYLANLDGRRYREVEEGKTVIPENNARVHRAPEVRQLAAKAMVQQKFSEMEKGAIKIVGFHGKDSPDAHPLIPEKQDFTLNFGKDAAGSGFMESTDCNTGKTKRIYDPAGVKHMQLDRMILDYKQALDSGHNARALLELKGMASEDVEQIVKLGTLAGMDIKRNGTTNVIDITTEDLKKLLSAEFVERQAYPFLATFRAENPHGTRDEFAAPRMVGASASLPANELDMLKDFLNNKPRPAGKPAAQPVAKAAEDKVLRSSEQKLAEPVGPEDKLKVDVVLPAGDTKPRVAIYDMGNGQNVPASQKPQTFTVDQLLTSPQTPTVPSSVAPSATPVK